MAKKMVKKSAKPKLEMVTEAPSVKLDLACGQTPIEGFEGVDFYAPNAKHKVDLFKFPFPWADNSVDELHCSHFVEHLPARDVEPRDLLNAKDAPRFVGKDFLFAFMDECWRVLKPGGKMRVIVPNCTSTRAFQDPTHRRFLTVNTFYYFSKEWREATKLNHYRVECNFGFSAAPLVSQDEALFSDEVRARRFNELWNVIHDWQADLIAHK